jgi:hypothetical protein
MYPWNVFSTAVLPWLWMTGSVEEISVVPSTHRLDNARELNMFPLKSWKSTLVGLLISKEASAQFNSPPDVSWCGKAYKST